ncbi:hypothetical protein BU15DRAFT_31013, partial [Melanogaster broomeanus]
DPRYLTLQGQVRKVEEHPVAVGGFSDIWSCELDRSSYLFLLSDDRDGVLDGLRERSLIPVAVKAVRIHSGSDEDGARKLTREMEIWKRLKHANILPLLGVTFGFGPLPALLCPWMDNGTITTYLE